MEERAISKDDDGDCDKPRKVKPGWTKEREPLYAFDKDGNSVKSFTALQIAEEFALMMNENLIKALTGDRKESRELRALCSSKNPADKLAEDHLEFLREFAKLPGGPLTEREKFIYRRVAIHFYKHGKEAKE